MSSRQPDNWRQGDSHWGILDMLRSCLSLDDTGEEDDFDDDLSSDNESLPGAQVEHAGYHAHRMEELYLFALGNLALREPIIDSQNERNDSALLSPILPTPVASEQEGREASKNPPHHTLESEASLACSASGYGPIDLTSGSVSTLDLSKCEVGVGGDFESETDNSECGDRESGPAPPVLSSAYPSDPGNGPEGEGEDDGNDDGDDDLGLTQYLSQSGPSSGAESTEKTIHCIYHDDDGDDGPAGPPTPPLRFATPSEYPQFDEDEEADSQVNSKLEVEHSQLPKQSTRPDLHTEEVSYNSTFPSHSNAGSRATGLTTPHPGYDEYDASGEENDEKDRDETDNAYRGLAVPGKESRENPVAHLLRQRHVIRSRPSMSPPAHESSLGELHRASPPSTIDPPAGTQPLGVITPSNEQFPMIKRVFGTVKSTCRFFTADHFDSTHESRQGGPAENAANVREKRIAPQVEFLARDFPARVFRGLLHDVRKEENSKDCPFGDSPNEADEKADQGDDEDDDGGEHKAQDGGWIIIGKERKKNV
ncbi:unnamed protein product [Tuber aestivum]|uniref:Uncharacterized protein n=1 Tax=Tuber aestivum TaxID=59557 RepID=A0A292Q1G5_9PEZI|nr:unnamed protein product [Tuber aestivum]